MLVDQVWLILLEGEQFFLDWVGKCQAIVLTTVLHDRNVYWYREPLGVPVCCPKPAVGTPRG